MQDDLTRFKSTNWVPWNECLLTWSETPPAS